jgi:1,4-dihydroxy-2-naphthoate octaprenyltransferase
MKKWISAARPRTLPLAISGILMGAMPLAGNSWNIQGTILAILTASMLQILSNLANDLGDFQNGADQVRNVGPSRAVQSGEITVSQMKMAIIWMMVLSLLLGSILIYQTLLVNNRWGDFWIMLGIGISAIIAAYTYTAGPRPYGYIGLGDLSVFLFFGVVGVMGTHFVLYDQINTLLLPRVLFIGGMSVAVLHLNNMRDMDDDAKAGKHTLALRLGWKGSKRYLIGLFLMTSVSLLMLDKTSWAQWFSLLPCLLLGISAWSIISENQPSRLDPFLKKFALACFFTVILLIVTSFL